MAFFSFLKPLATLAAGTFLGAAGAEAVGALLGDDEMKATTTAVVPLAVTPLAGERTQAQALKTPVATGAARQRTIVQTISDRGVIIKQKIFKGGVAVFKADVTAANRVARQLRKLDKRMPRKLVKQSEIARLKDEVTEQALRDARDGRGCPPKSC